MKLFQIHLQGHREPIKLELELEGIEELADYASKARFLVGYLLHDEEEASRIKVLIAATRISCAIEMP